MHYNEKTDKSGQKEMAGVPGVRIDRNLFTWIDLRVKDIAIIMEKRRLEGEKRRNRFGEKMEDLKERYEKVMERRIERMRKNGINITLEEFRNRADPEMLKKSRNLEEEEYRKLFDNARAESVNSAKCIDDTAKDGENEAVHTDDSEIDSDREVVDCEMYGIPSSVEPETFRPSINILRPVVTGQSSEASSLNILRSLVKGHSVGGPDVSILRPTLQEPNEGELPQTEQTELDPIAEDFQSNVKTIKLKQKHKKHHHHHVKPKPKRTNSQAMFKKIGHEHAVSDNVEGQQSINPELVETPLCQNSSGDLLLSESKERVRKASAKLRVIKAFGGSFNDSNIEQQSSGETETRKYPLEKTDSTRLFSMQARSVLKKTSSRSIVYNDSQHNHRTK